MIKKGMYMSAESGEWSDYCVNGFFIALKDFDPMPLLEEYLEANPEDRESYSFHEDAFLAKLLQEGYLEEIDYGRIFLGSYSCAEHFRYSTPKG